MKIFISFFLGRRLVSRPTAEAGPVKPRAAPARLAPALPSALACLRARSPAGAPRRVPTASGRARRVAALRWQRPPRGSHGLAPPPRARLLLPRSAASSPLLLPLSQPQSNTSSFRPRATRARHRRRRCLDGSIPLPRLHSPIHAASSSA